MDVVNNTDDDAECKVVTGTGGTDRDWKLTPGKSVKLPSLPPGSVLHFTIEIGEMKLTSTVKGLKLTRGKKGLQVQVIKGGKGEDEAAGARASKGEKGRRLPLSRGQTDATVTASPERDEIKAVANERSEILGRRHGGRALLQNERDRLESLTARLNELLPPVSPGELEVLVEMVEKAERIRKRARARRQRLD